MSALQCRLCGAPLSHTFLDLGVSPLANSYLKPEQLAQPEVFYPLHARVCDRCFLVQVDAFELPEHIFSDYLYFSSYSQSWLRHAKDYVEMITGRLGLGASSQVVEIASNDGYLLQYFVERGVPVLGIEPAENVARVAREKGVATLVKFFGTQTARELVTQGKQADLLIGNNVLAHTPLPNDFVAGLKLLLKRTGVVTMEFPHLLRLIEDNQFDTIYHEHFSYFSFLTVRELFARHGLELFEVQQLATHGGSLRIYARHAEDRTKAVMPSVAALLAAEKSAGLSDLATYTSFSQKAYAAKFGLLSFLAHAKCEGKRVVGYGAPAKGNTLLNFCGIRTDFLDYTVDVSPYKQGTFLPGTHIPVFGPEKIAQTRPDYVLILPWNLRDEIVPQLAHVRDWGGKLVVPIPRVEVIA
ncbi:MAG TPA: class I SAM-dependent methyltransferase [Terriglobales bacterium]|nr:class I SAM-dependent methyltransferase [Terriglobales bacterium]